MQIGQSGIGRDVLVLDLGAGGAYAAESSYFIMAVVAGKKQASELAYVIVAQSDEFLKIGSKEHRVQSSTPKRWCKPRGDTLKINVDGSYIAETSCGGWGFAISFRWCYFLLRFNGASIACVTFQKKYY